MAQFSLYADGYYGEGFALEPTSPQTIEQHLVALLQGGVLLPGEFEGEAQVVLQKKGELTKLTEYSYVLSYAPDGSGRVADFSKPPHSRYSGLAEPPPNEGMDPLATRNVDASKTWPEDGVVILADSDEGRLKLVPVYPDRPDGALTAAGLRLVATDKDGGFIRFEPEKREIWSRDMRRAPADGYERELRLGPQDSREFTNSHPVYFYFRSNGKYGKGFIGGASTRADGTMATVGIVFFLQPDGSGNLETGNDDE